MLYVASGFLGLLAVTRLAGLRDIFKRSHPQLTGVFIVGGHSGVTPTTEWTQCFLHFRRTR
jgi:hypothetical protein